VKIEINCKEHFTVLNRVGLPLEVENGWFTGEALIKTYALNELLGTKLRALYQRKKGRDLFDLFYARNHEKFNAEELTSCFNSYMKFSTDSIPTRRQFELNMEEKEKDPVFSGDMEALLRPNIQYDEKSAFHWLKNEVISFLRSSSKDKS
jgi:predicted nucleotidyltransferase component of viral defense system